VLGTENTNSCVVFDTETTRHAVDAPDQVAQ
jgi:hypothetical protein